MYLEIHVSKMLQLLLLQLVIIKLSSCERRVTNGSRVDRKADTSFVVYIVKKTPGSTPGWMCGGSIIHPSLILTSAACLDQKDNLYVIAGYRKYVPSEKLENDTCTKNLKHPISSYCVHRDYATTGEKETEDEEKYKWTKYDIAVARILIPIDFYGSFYLKYCSYRPSSVGINYNSKYEESPANVVVYGWGHSTYYRPEGDTNDYNQSELRYASSMVLPRVECKQYFENEYLKDRVGNSYICTSGDLGELDSRGMHSFHSPPLLEQCADYYRRTGLRGNSTVCSSGTNTTGSHNGTINMRNTRRNGICQNDHGSPLVLWIGGHPFAVGVASAFHVNKRMECVGPYLFTSVSCTSVFIHCILSQQTTLKARRTPSICDSPKERGFYIRNVEIDWSKDY